MKKIMGFLVLAAVLQCFIINPVPATTIVDTGSSASESGGYGITYGNFDGKYQWQYVAAQFSLSQPSTLTSVQGWIGSIDAGNADFVIYANSGSDLPGTEVSRTSLYIPKTYDDITNKINAGWYGPSGLSVNLAAGTYWVSFETKDHFFYGTLPNPSTKPLSREAVYAKNDLADPPIDYWYASDLNLGVRIYGKFKAVPIPGSLFLLLD